MNIFTVIDKVPKIGTDSKFQKPSEKRGSRNLSTKNLPKSLILSKIVETQNQNKMAVGWLRG
jgi:hypothetical protein